MIKKEYFFNNFIAFSLFTCALSMATSEEEPFSYDEVLQMQLQEQQQAKNFNTVEEIQHTINKIKNNAQNEVIAEIKHITHCPYQLIKVIVNNRRVAKKKSLQKESYNLNHSDHDAHIPIPIYKNLLKSINEENINPNNIKITYTDYHEMNLGSSTCTPPTIEICKLLSECDDDVKLFIYKYGLHSIFLRNPLIQGIASLFTSDLKKLNSIINKEIDIHIASTNAQLAYTAMEGRCSLNNKKINITANKESCKEMIRLYALMQRKAELS